MPQLTVVVPLMDQVDAFEMTLASILRFCDHRIQLVVTHDGRYEDPHQILEEVESIVIPSHRNTSVIGRVAAAAEACQSPWIHWVAPGIEVTQAWCDELLESLASRSDLGLISPLITSDNPEEDPANDFHCVASCVMQQANGHPLYLEDVWGEDWNLDEVADDPALVGPTGWAGFCRRQLLEQWHSQWHRHRLPEGYAELTLGLMVRNDGWEHEISDSQLHASEEIAAQMERGFRRDGRAAAEIIGRFQPGSAVSKLVRSFGYGVKELLTSVLYPGNAGVALARFGNLSRACISVETNHDSVLSMPRTHQDDEPANKRRAA